ncbi:hypothetical protein [Burkholderia cepacia]|uniref:hypothetical protein n=1 Tax=Burkholderia cepacia TaxID=292 RepID=UPI000A660220|nr:hypothetical protein [Burkholderia cepacia]
MKKKFGFCLVGVAFIFVCAFPFYSAIAASDNTQTAVETLVFVRHAEKPAGGLGQITCQGLNRALALPGVLIAKFGRPDYIFAPNTTKTRVIDPDGTFDYIRPLVTIEPTAIRLGMPVNTTFGFSQIDDLKKELLGSAYVNSLVFIAWEHIKLEAVVKNILDESNGNSSVVPKWSGKDYDSIYVVTIKTDGEGRKAAIFRQDYQQLDGQSIGCPGG